MRGVRCTYCYTCTSVLGYQIGRIVERDIVCMRIDLRSQLDLGMSHQVPRRVQRNTSILQVGAICMPYSRAGS